MLKNFLMRQMLKRQMKDVPADQQEKILKMVEENPQFFEDIAKKIQEKMKSGMSQMDASMAVMQEHRDEVAKMMNK
jgi:hypothetical protein